MSSSSLSSKRCHAAAASNGDEGNNNRNGRTLRSWDCGACTFINRGSNSFCAICGTNRSHHNEVAAQVAVKQESTTEEENRSTPVVITPPRQGKVKQEPKAEDGEDVTAAAVETVLPQISVKQEPKEEEESVSNTNTTASATATASATVVKTEKDWQNHVAKTHRKYGDRVLLARQASNGIMKLGGGNCRMALYPGPNNTNHPRFNAIGDKYAICYNDLWQPFGPKYAGDPSGAVMTVHGETERPFSVFMRRGNLGNEYCGDYKYAQDPDVANYRRASDVPEGSKTKMLKDMLTSLESNEGEWRGGLEDLKIEYNNQLANDPSPADIRDTASVAARLRALGYHSDMSLEDMAQKIVLNMNEFFGDHVIKFVGYDEQIYEYVKAGETTKNASGKSRRRGKNGKYCEPCAKASDWYNKLDQKVN